MREKITKSRWAMLAFALACIIVLFNVAGCSMLQNPFNTWGGDTIEVPVCEGEGCEVGIRG